MSVRKLLSFAVSITLLGGASQLVSAEEWPQWRGPDRDAKSASTGLLDEWSDDGPPLLWKASGFGGGFSSLAIAGDRVYTLGDQGEKQYAIAARRDGGEILWRTEIGPHWEDQYGGPRSTPTVAGDAVYVLGTDGDLVALKVSDGSVIWRRNLQKDFGGQMMDGVGADWRYSESPLVDGDRVVVTPGAKKAMLVALERGTGEEIWRTELPELGPEGADGAAYSSIVPMRVGDRDLYVQLVGRGLIGVDAETGAFLWGYNKIANNVANIPTPLLVGNDRVFVSTGYQTGAALLQLAARDGGVTAEEVYFLPGNEVQNHHGGMVLDQGYVYLGSGHNKGFPLALEVETGEVAWGPKRNRGKGSAAALWADGDLIFRYQDGRVLLIEATPDGYNEKGNFRIPDVATFSWSHPVVVDGLLYLREQDQLLVYDLRAPTEEAAAR